jgi:hypothetical protein
MQNNQHIIFSGLLHSVRNDVGGVGGSGGAVGARHALPLHPTPYTLHTSCVMRHASVIANGVKQSREIFYMLHA